MHGLGRTALTSQDFLIAGRSAPTFPAPTINLKPSATSWRSPLTNFSMNATLKSPQQVPVAQGHSPGTRLTALQVTSKPPSAGVTQRTKSVTTTATRGSGPTLRSVRCPTKGRGSATRDIRNYSRRRRDVLKMHLGTRPTASPVIEQRQNAGVTTRIKSAPATDRLRTVRFVRKPMRETRRPTMSSCH